MSLLQEASWFQRSPGIYARAGRRPRLGLLAESGYPWSVEFEWDPKKAANNLRKHRVSFAEATTVVGDPLSITAPDPDHSLGEDRDITVGRSIRGRLLIVSHTERSDRVRIISARELTPLEREAYEDQA
ncbi:MAG TPA: BrnT family toxin [Thermoanaerobaculia bacterium]